MRKKRPISQRLFKSYAILFGSFLCILMAFFIVYVTINIEGNLVKTQQQLSINIQENVENYFSRMNSFSLDLLNSKEFCRIVIDDLPKTMTGQPDSGHSAGDYFTELYTAAYKMFERGYKVGVVTDSGYYIWLGSSYFIHPLRDKTPDIYQNYVNLGEMTIRRLERNPYLEQALDSPTVSSGNVPLFDRDTGEILTLSRSINRINRLNYKQAMLEIQVPMDEVRHLIDRLSAQAESGVIINLYDAGGQPLYEQFALEGKQLINGMIRQGWNRIGSNMVEVMPVLSGNLYVVSMIPVSLHYRSMALFVIIAVGVSVLLIFLLLFITYKLSRRISQPVGEMCGQIEKMNYDVSSRQALPKVDTDIYELDFLAQTISDLQIKLRDSLDEIVRLESYEIQAQLLALQTQMQPHFLYNTLMTMSAIAESNNDWDVIGICQALTGMLRYIAVKNNEGVTIAEELLHLENFMQIMKVRFPRMTLDINIPVHMMPIRIPRLIIQPLVENCFKYSERADCHIEVTGWIHDNCWTMRVNDNGQGFQDEKIKELLERLSRIKNDHSKASRKIDGMGLENIYMRLYLHYKDDMAFKIFHNPQGGACVDIGGLVR